MSQVTLLYTEGEKHLSGAGRVKVESVTLSRLYPASAILWGCLYPRQQKM